MMVYLGLETRLEVPWEGEGVEPGITVNILHTGVRLVLLHGLLGNTNIYSSPIPFCFENGYTNKKMRMRTPWLTN